MASWKGATLEQVVSQWGAPDDVEEDYMGSGYNLYFWGGNSPVETIVEQVKIVDGVKITKKMIEGGGNYMGPHCIRSLKVDDDNIVVTWAYTGNNCPFMDIAMGYQHWERKVSK